MKLAVFYLHIPSCLLLVFVESSSSYNPYQLSTKIRNSQREDSSLARFYDMTKEYSEGGRRDCSRTAGAVKNALSFCSSVMKRLEELKETLTGCQSDLGDCTSDLGDCTSDLGDCTSDLGGCTSDLGDCTSDLGDCTSDLGTCPGDLGTCGNNLIDCQMSLTAATSCTMEKINLCDTPDATLTEPICLSAKNILCGASASYFPGVHCADGSSCTHAVL